MTTLTHPGATIHRATWADITTRCRILAEHLDDWRPDCIAAAGIGGLTPAALLAAVLGMPRIAAVDIGYTDGGRFDPLVYTTPTWLLHPPERLLVVDATTGRQLDLAAALLGYGAGTVRTAALYQPVTPGGRAHADYVADHTPTIPVMPWDASQ